MRLEGKVAIVTGATSGMGRATAKLFAKEGAKVVVTGRNAARAQEVIDDIKAAGGEAMFVLGDASDPTFCEEIVNKTLEAYKTVDILVNNAGMLSMSSLMDVTLEEWDRVFRVNVDAALRLAQLTAPVMKAKGKGVIVNIASVASFAAHHGFAGYISSKHAMAGLSKSMAWERKSESMQSHPEQSIPLWSTVSAALRLSRLWLTTARSKGSVSRRISQMSRFSSQRMTPPLSTVR